MPRALKIDDDGALPALQWAVPFGEISMSSYMLLFWAPKHLLAKPRSAEQARESGERWDAWQQTLQAAGHSVTGAQLGAGGRCVTGATQIVAERTFGNDDVMGGYFVVSASSLDEATELAKGCPVLQSGGTVEVRPVMDAD
jgi:hypothetical protein